MSDNKKQKIGSIYYDKRDKRFRCTYYITNADTLEEVRKTKSFLTELEAKKFLSTIQCQKGNELFVKNNGIPLNELMKLTAKRKLDMNLIKERQYKRILETISSIEKSPLAKKNIETITSEEIQSYLNTLTHYSQSTIKKIFEQFTQNYKFAMDKGYITKNPLVDVIKPKSKKAPKIVRPLEVEEQQALTNYLTNISLEQEPLKNAFLIEMFLGLRIGEILALRSTDINLQKNLVSVNKTLTLNLQGELIMGHFPKTYAGIREVPIPPCVKDALILQMKIAENNKDKQLFLSKTGTYVDPRNANRNLKSILSNLGIYDITTHNLRHTYGTRCIEAGMRTEALQRLMGHSKHDITIDTYVGILNKYKETEIAKVNQYYLNNNMFNNTNSLLLENNNKEIIENEI